MKINWIKEIEEKQSSVLEIKLSFIDEFKKRVMKKHRLKDEGSPTEKSERWCYFEKTFGYLHDSFSNKTYKVDMKTGKIKLNRGEL